MGPKKIGNRHIPEQRKLSREERAQLKETRVPEKQIPRATNSQPPLELAQEKQLFKKFYELIQLNKTKENICNLKANQYYTNLFVLCSADGLHDTRLPRTKGTDSAEEKRQSEIRQVDGNNYFKKVGRAILDEYLEYIDSLPEADQNAANEEINPQYQNVTYKDFFKTISTNNKSTFNVGNIVFTDIEDYILNMLVQNDGYANKIGLARNLYNFCKDQKQIKEQNNQYRFCDQNGFWKGVLKWKQITEDIVKDNKEFKSLNELISSVPATFSGENCFLNIDMGVTSTLIDGLNGKVGTLRNAWNNSRADASAPGIAVEFGNMNIRFQIDGSGDKNYLKFESEYMIINKVNGETYIGDENFSSFTGAEETNLISNEYKILLKVKVTRKKWNNSENTAIYIYELYPVLTQITINEELIQGNRNDKIYQGISNRILQQDNLGSYASKYKTSEFPPIGNDFDYIFTVRKALCDYLQSLQTCVKYGGNSVLQPSLIADYINYFPEDNTIIKYEIPTNKDIQAAPQSIKSGDQIRMSVHNDRPAVALAYYLIANTQTGNPNQGMNVYAHTSSCFIGKNFFISNNQGCVISLLYVGNSVIKFKTNQQGGMDKIVDSPELPNESQLIDDESPIVESPELPNESQMIDNVSPIVESPLTTIELEIIDLFTERQSDAANLKTINNILNFKCSEDDLIKLNEDNLKICNFLYGIKDKLESQQLKEGLNYIKIDELGIIIVPYAPAVLESEITPETPDDVVDNEIINIFPNLFENLIFFKKDDSSEYYKYGYALNVSYTSSELPTNETEVMLEDIINVRDLWSLNQVEAPVSDMEESVEPPEDMEESEAPEETSIIANNISSKKSREQYDRELPLVPLESSKKQKFGGNDTKKRRKIKRKTNTIKKNKKYSKKTQKHKKIKHKKKSIKH